MSDSMVVIPIDDARRFIDPSIGFDRASQNVSRKRNLGDPHSYKVTRNISEGNKRINLKRKEAYNPVEPEYLSETPLLVIPKRDEEPSAPHEPAVIEEQASMYDEILEKLKLAGAIDEHGNIYKKNGTTESGNAFELLSFALNKGSKLKKRDVGIYTLAQWIKELGFRPKLFNNHFQGLLNSPIVTRSKALATSTPSTSKSSGSPAGWINF